MSSAKRLFFKLGRPFTRFMSLKFLVNLSGIRRYIPVYHAVSDEALPHLRFLYKVRTVRQFEDDLEVMLRHFKPIDLQELTSLTRGGRHPASPVFHLTFDDGLSEFYHIAAPILRKKGIPATCFLNNHFIDNRNMMYRLKVSILIDHLNCSFEGSESWSQYHQWLEKHHYEKAYYRKLFLRMGYEDMPQVEELASEMGIDFRDYLSRNKPYLSTSQINELRAQGFTFGAHTAEHLDFRELDESEQYDQMAASLQGLQSAFSLPEKVFSFPFTDFGVGKPLFGRVEKDKLCDLTFGCAGIKDDSVSYNLQRVPVEEYGNNFLADLKTEYLYYLFLKLMGRSRIKR